MVLNIKKVLVCDAVDKACIELLQSNGISVRIIFFYSNLISFCVEKYEGKVIDIK